MITSLPNFGLSSKRVILTTVLIKFTLALKAVQPSHRACLIPAFIHYPANTSSRLVTTSARTRYSHRLLLCSWGSPPGICFTCGAKQNYLYVSGKQNRYHFGNDWYHGLPMLDGSPWYRYCNGVTVSIRHLEKIYSEVLFHMRNLVVLLNDERSVLMVLLSRRLQSSCPRATHQMLRRELPAGNSAITGTIRISLFYKRMFLAV